MYNTYLQELVIAVDYNGSELTSKGETDANRRF